MSVNVLVTGSAGRVGRSAVAALVSAGHRVTGFDRTPTPGLPADRGLVGDLTDAAVVEAAVRTADVVVHLAAAPDDAKYPRGAPPDDGDNFLSELVPANVVGAYNVVESARRCGVKRLILASSVQVVDEHITEGLVGIIGTDATPRPRYLYACTKVFLEALGRVYAENHRLDVLAVRLGWLPRDAKQEAELAGLELLQNLYFSPDDVGRFFVAAVEAAVEPRRFRVVYATSRHRTTPLFDLAATRDLLGWEPRDVWPDGL